MIYFLVIILFLQCFSKEPPSIISEFDPSSCSPLLWTSSTSSPAINHSIMNYSYALTLTSSKSRHLKQLLDQLSKIVQLIPKTTPIAVVIQNNIPNLANILKKIQNFIQTLSTSSLSISSSSPLDSRINIFQFPHPLEQNILTKSYFLLLKNSFQYSNPAQFFQLNLFLLPYDRVIYLHPRLRLLKPINHLFLCSPHVDLFYTNTQSHFFDQHFYFIISNHPNLYHEMLKYLVSYVWKGSGPGGGGRLGGSRGGSSHQPYQTALHEFFYYYFILLPLRGSSPSHQRTHQSSPLSSSLRTYRISSCLYNFHKFPLSLCSSEFFQQYTSPPSSPPSPPTTILSHSNSTANGVSPYIIQTSSPWLNKQLQPIFQSPATHQPLSSWNTNQDLTNKPCRPDFWIIGARKSGTTALYTWLTEHPQVAPLNIRNQPTDGEIMIALTQENLLKYNKIFQNGLEKLSEKRGVRKEDRLLVGDSWVGRFLNEDYRTISICQERNLKILLILRDPIERCVSQWKMRYRREVGRLSLNGTRTGTNRGGGSEGNKVLESRVDEIAEMIKKGYDLNTILAQELQDYLSHSSSSSSSQSSSFSLIPSSLNNWKGSENCIYEGMYSTHLRRWLVVHGIDNLRIYFTEDLERYPQDIIHDALRFIGVSNISKWNYEPSRHSKRSAPNRDVMNLTITLESSSSSSSSSSLLKRLREVFAPSNRELERLLGIERVPWGY